MGQVAGYIAADDLVQYANQERRYARLPASTGDALPSHTRDHSYAARLGESARNLLDTATPSRCTVRARCRGSGGLVSVRGITGGDQSSCRGVADISGWVVESLTGPARPDTGDPSTAIFRILMSTIRLTQRHPERHARPRTHPRRTDRSPIEADADVMDLAPELLLKSRASRPPA